MKKKRKLLLEREAEIVGINHYDGEVAEDKAIRFLREPDNQYDSNAIKVINDNKDQVGYLDRKTAKFLAPFMDKKKVKLRCELVGQGDGFCIPIRLEIYKAKGDSCLTPGGKKN